MNEKLSDRLKFKSLVFPYWFGCDSADWDHVAESIDEYIDQNIQTEVNGLLSIEDSPNYWIEGNAWPHPDIKFMQELTIVIDTSAPVDWGLEVKSFCLAWSIQAIRMNMLSAFRKIAYHRLYNSKS